MPFSPSPRPILKRAYRTSDSAPRPFPPHPAVHFPPSPTLTRTFSAHSPTSYDRSPIEVGPNSCALPERGCPGRTYTLDEDDQARLLHLRPPSRPYQGQHCHPRALERCHPLPDVHVPPPSSSMQNHYLPPQPSYHHHQQALYPSMPPLIPDVSSSSSESEESDGVHSPPSTDLFSSHHHHNHHNAYSRSSSPSRHIHGLAIPTLKHPGHQTYDMYDVAAAASPPSGHSIGMSPSTPTPLSFLPHPPSPPDDDCHSRRRRKRSPTHYRRHRASSPLDLCRAMSNVGLQDGPDAGCLGGF